MRRLLAAALLPLLMAGCGASSPAVPRATRHPLRVFSANQCTDQIVLALLPPERIASVSWLSRDPGGSMMAAAARRVAVNRGQTEEVIAQRPDLVVAGSFTTPALRGMLRRLGYPMIEVEQAGSFDLIRRTTRQIAAAVDERARGEALIARMDRDLADLARDPGPPIRVAAWDRGGFAAGKGTLFDAVITAAGARNVAAALSSPSFSRPDVERLLRAGPALLVQGSGNAGEPSLGDDATGHPLVRRYWATRTLTIPQRYYVCGTPMIAEAAMRLRTQLRGAIDRAGPALPVRGSVR